MEINIESPRLKLSQTLTHKIEHKLMHLQRFYNRITACNIVVFKQKDAEQKDCFIELKLFLPKEEFYATEHAENFDKALYMGIKNLLRQVKKHKEQITEIR